MGDGGAGCFAVGDDKAVVLRREEGRAESKPDNCRYTLRSLPNGASECDNGPAKAGQLPPARLSAEATITRAPGVIDPGGPVITIHKNAKSAPTKLN
jgi:hypothetical protein